MAFFKAYLNPVLLTDSESHTHTDTHRDTLEELQLFFMYNGGMPSHSILVRRHKITARHIEKHLNVFTHTHSVTHTHTQSHTHSHIFFVQTRIIHNFISALRSTYRVQKQQTEFTAAGLIHTARLDL